MTTTTDEKKAKKADDEKDPEAEAERNEDSESRDLVFNEFVLMIETPGGAVPRIVFSDETYEDAINRVAQRGNSFVSFPKTLGGGEVEIEEGVFVDSVPYFGVRASKIISIGVNLTDDQDEDDDEDEGDQTEAPKRPRARVLPDDFKL